MRYPLPAKQHKTRKFASTRRKRVRWMLSSFWLSCSSKIASCRGRRRDVQRHRYMWYKRHQLLCWITNTHLETGGDGGKLVVCSFRVSYQVIPAGEHFPAEIKAVIISNPRLIRITGHPLIRNTTFNITLCSQEISLLHVVVMNLRPYDDHIAIGHCSHTDQKIRQRHTKLEPTNGTLVVVITVEEDWILSVTLWKWFTRRNHHFSNVNELTGT